MHMMNIYYRSLFHNFAYRLGQVREQLGFVAPLTAQDYKEVAALLPTAAALSLFRTMSPADQQHSLRVCRKLRARGCKDKDMLAAALLHDVGKAQGRVPFWTRPAIVLGKKFAPQLLTRLVIYPENGNEEPPDRTMHPQGDRKGSPLLYDENTAQPRSSPEGDRKGSPLLYPEDTTQPRSSIVGAIPCGRPVQGGGPVHAGRPVHAGHPGRATLPHWRLSLCYAWYHADVGADLARAAGLSERAVLYIRTHHQPGGPAAELHEVDEVS